MTIRTEIKTIYTLKRLRLSTNGNPRFRVTFTDGTVANTQSDASIGYGIENREFRNAPLEVTFTRAGLISHAQPLTGQKLDRYLSTGETI